MTEAEARAQFPQAFTDAIGMPDRRLDETMVRNIVHFLNEGDSAFDAKLKALCVAIPPDHYKQVPSAGAWPKLLYNEEGQTKLAADEDELKRFTKQGWTVTPTPKALDKLQRGSVPRDENIKRLQRELDKEIKAKEAETAAA